MSGPTSKTSEVDISGNTVSNAKLVPFPDSYATVDGYDTKAGDLPDSYAVIGGPIPKKQSPLHHAGTATFHGLGKVSHGIKEAVLHLGHLFKEQGSGEAVASNEPPVAVVTPGTQPVKVNKDINRL